MIKLFVLDVDGCISIPFKSPDFEVLSAIKDLQIRSFEDPAIPSITICSGRPMTYIEAVAQWLGVKHPFVFESGGGIYDVKANRLHWSPEFNSEVQSKQQEFRTWVLDEIIAKNPGTILEFTKKTDVGIINQSEKEIIRMYNAIKEEVEKNYPFMEVHRTEISVNAILKASNKGFGLEQLSTYTGIGLDEMAYIGDSSGDIPALQKAEIGFVPANGTKETHQYGISLKSSATEAVLEAYEKLIEHNLLLQQTHP